MTNSSSRVMEASSEVEVALLKAKLETVKIASYVCYDLEKPTLSHLSLSSEIPVIDMGVLLASEDNNNSELQKLHLACKDWGFFQIMNHGVNGSLLERVKSETEKFFLQPKEEKKKFEQKEGDLEGLAEILVTSNDIESRVGMFYMITQPPQTRKPHLFPELPVSFRDTLEDYSVQVNEIAMKLFNKMAKALGIKEEDLNGLADEGQQSMRMNYYPKCPQPDVVMGLNPHTDSISLTILLQVNEVEGLQIKKNGAWIPVAPLPNAFVVNIGNMLEILTNGIYKSIEHRPVFNPNKERISIATFSCPRRDSNLSPAQSLINPQNPPKFKQIGTVDDYFKGYLSQQYNGKPYLDNLRMENKEEDNK